MDNNNNVNRMNVNSRETKVPEEESPIEEPRLEESPPTYFQPNGLPYMRLLRKGDVIEIITSSYTAEETAKLFDHVVMRLLNDLKEDRIKEKRNPITG